METLPQTLVDSLPSELQRDAESWWQTLSDADQDELTRLCDARKNLFLFETFAEAENKPQITGGKFIPGANAFGIEDWGEDYFQHLLDHPELMIVFEPVQRTFHIGCWRHLAARRCFVEGKIPESFECPFDARICRMHQVMGERAGVSLRPYTRRAEN